MSTTEQVSTAVPTGTWQVDRVHSSVGFEVGYQGVSAFSGTVTDFNATLVDGALEGSAQIASVQTKDENLSGHLLSPDFFDAERFPEVGFASDEVTRNGNTVEVDGEVTLKGITKPATLRGTITGPVNDAYGKQRLALKLETTIDRTEFGITWNAPMPDGSNALSNDVTLKADLVLVAAE
ncbi:MAG TPA: YceI family protein [Gaiellaceae bacterium]|nr:YceI family protein [Gaiellaceae bacterium]